MRNKLAKKLRKDVMNKLYIGDGVTEKDIRKGKHDIMKEPEFKQVFRSRKKNEKRKSPVVKHMLVNTEYDPKMKLMHDKRITKTQKRM